MRASSPTPRRTAKPNLFDLKRCWSADTATAGLPLPNIIANRDLDTSRLQQLMLQRRVCLWPYAPRTQRCPLLGVKRTSDGGASTSAIDPDIELCGSAVRAEAKSRAYAAPGRDNCQATNTTLLIMTVVAAVVATAVGSPRMSMVVVNLL